MGRSQAALLRLGWAWACLLGWAVAAWGQALQPIPPLTGRVVDAAAWLSPEQRASLESRLAGIEAKSGSQIAILTVPTTQPEPIEAYSIRVVDAWKLGRKGVDDGILILLARNDRVARIEVGRGLEGVIPDVIAKRIVEEQMIPRFRQGDVAGGLEAGVAAVEARLAGEALPTPIRPQQRRGGGQDWIGFVLMAALFGGQVLRALLGPLLGPGLAASLVGAGVWWISGSVVFGVGAGVAALLFLLGGGGRGGSGPWISGGGGRGGFGGGGSGGWSGGGGGFSGGGASGRW